MRKITKKPKKNQIKAIIFDVGGVLVLAKSSRYLKNFRSEGVHFYISEKLNLRLDQWFDSIELVYDDAIEGEVSKSRFITTIANNVKTRPKKLKELFIRAYKENYYQNKELYRVAFKLKKKGYKIAILSDQQYLSKEALMPKERVKGFNVVVVSCDVGTRKPKPEIYKLALKKLKLKPKECVFIENQIWNIKPAKKLGMHTILFKNNKQTIKELKKLGVRVK